MEKRISNIRGKVSPLSLLLLLMHFICSCSYVTPEDYFINCGSSRTVNHTGRRFSGDKKHTKKHSYAVTTDQPLINTSALYKTARIFTQQSSYAFEIDSGPSSTYVVRLHFFAFNISQFNLSAAVFDVATSMGHLLLSSFSGKDSEKAPLVKELYVTVNSTKFRIYFTPRESSVAFLNAIEFFPAPPVAELDFNKDTDRRTLKSRPVMRTVYRINVGNEKIEPQDDRIWREWNRDEEFLMTKDAPSDFGSSVHTSEETELAAPNLVYETARKMKDNITHVKWSFKVNESSDHIVRAHFCDFSNTNYNILLFNFYINETLQLENYTLFPGVPNHTDFLVAKLTSGVLKISIGPSKETNVWNAYLNGLEIFEIKEGLAFVPIEKEPKPRHLVEVVASVSAFLCASVAATVLFMAARRKKAAGYSSYGGASSHSRSVAGLNLGLRIPLSEIQSATKRFDESLVIGKGGFGSVYRGTLCGGTAVAVKRSAGRESGQGLAEFHTEITLLSQIRHRHLVSLIGYCDEREEMILVYDFMENGTLKERLPELSWKQRLEVCIGAAKGLNYLHSELPGRIIHRDVKSSNILLDRDMVAKVADFGISKAGPPGDSSHVSTSDVKGTMGYFDPEYFMTQQLSEKSDVYSFGVVLLEVLSARPPIDLALSEEEVNLAEWAMKCKREGLFVDLVDGLIKDEIDPNSLRKFGDAAEKCLHKDSWERPGMSDVLWDLQYALELQCGHGNDFSHTAGSDVFLCSE